MIKLLDEQLRMELLGKNLFDISSTIFVCNKWDQVPADEDAHVMGFIQSRLQECMAVAEKHIDVDKQVLRFSGKKVVV